MRVGIKPNPHSAGESSVVHRRNMLVSGIQASSMIISHDDEDGFPWSWSWTLSERPRMALTEPGAPG
jgi:hypothetical protein